MMLSCIMLINKFYLLTQYFTARYWKFIVFVKESLRHKIRRANKRQAPATTANGYLSTINVHTLSTDLEKIYPYKYIRP